MSDSFWGRIKVGGKLPREKIDDFIRALEEDVLVTDPEGSVTEVLQKVIDEHRDGEKGYLEFEESEAINGAFPTLEDFCEENGLHFVRESSQFCEYNACEQWYSPGALKEKGINFLDSDSREIVFKSDMEELIEAVREVRDVENAPKYMAEEGIKRELADYLLSSESPDVMEFMHNKLEELCPEPPEIPPFEIVG